MNGQRVKEQTAEALRRAMRELNYHPNENARRLTLNRTQVIGVVLDDISNSFYSGILQGVGESSVSRGYDCVFYNMIPDYEGESSFLGLVQKGRVDGLIMLSFRKRGDDEVSSIVRAGVPVVLFGDDGGGSEICSVDVDNFSGAVGVVSYLRDIGHEKIAHISGPDAMAASAPRRRGYEEAMQQSGVTMESGWIFEADWTVEGGYRAMEEVLKKGGFTAVFASNDSSAAGAIKAIREAGLRVPEDISVAGFDDSSFASLLTPALTTVRQPWQQIGSMLAGATLDLIDGKERSPRRQVLEPELVIRDSCAAV